MSNARTQMLSVRISDELKEALVQLAENDTRTISNYVEKVLKAHVEIATLRKTGKGK